MRKKRATNRVLEILGQPLIEEEDAELLAKTKRAVSIAGEVLYNDITGVPVEARATLAAAILAKMK